MEFFFKIPSPTLTTIAVSAVTHLPLLITVYPLSVQEGLVALWDCDDESKDEASDDKTRDMPAVSSEPHVDKLWHRLAENQMVVGVILTTDGSV